MIVLKPTSGLCNRIRMIDACISVQQNSGKKHTMKMVWEKNELLNCPFELLFKPIENITRVDTEPHLSYFLYYKDRPAGSFKDSLRKKIYAISSSNFQYFDDNSIQQVAYDEAYWRNTKKDFVIHSCIDFYSKELQHATSFVPIPTLQERIKKETEKFLLPTTGIHIRRTDSVKSINSSSTDLFIKRITALLTENPDQLFFLATDDENEEATLRSVFGDRILSQQNKDLDRNSQKGIQDALVDLYTLSKTERILGSYWSSFSKTAAALGNIPLEIIN